MICYRDMTFCSFYKECKNPCGRSLTEEVEKEADSAHLLISQFIEKPECFIGKEAQNET